GGRALRVELARERIRIAGARLQGSLDAARAALALAGVAPSLLVLPPASVVATCPFCKDTLSQTENEGCVRCPSCETSHHASCWKDNSGCAIHGCERGPRGRE